MKFILFLFNLLYSISIFAQETLYIASAANFSKSLKKIASLFEMKNPGVTIKITSGSSGILTNQIAAGAPFDIIFSADKKYIEYLDKSNKIIKDSTFTFAIGKLVLWMPNKNIKYYSETEIKQVLSLQKSPIAIADSNTAPFGAASRQFLDQIYTKDEQKKMQFIYGRNIEQTFYYVDSGSSTCGFISLSNVIERHNEKEYWVVPQKYYLPISQQSAIISQTKNIELSKIFIAFFKKNSEVYNIITQSGYEHVLSKR